MTTIPIAKLDDVSGVKAPQPYTVADLELGRKLVRQLHGVGSGFDAWAEHLAKAIVAERTASSERIRVLEDALQRIALLDEADGHELTWEHASRAVAIATSTLGKHPSQIHAERQGTADGAVFGRPTQSTSVLEAARNLSTAMINTESTGAEYEAVDKEWQELTAAIVSADETLTQSTREQGEAWDAGGNRYYEPVEKRAAEIYATYKYVGLGEKPAWVPHGNSLMQDEARHTARQELYELGHIPVVTNREAPAAEAVAELIENEPYERDKYSIRTAKSHLHLFHFNPAHMSARDILHAVNAIRSVPVPAPGVTVTDEMVERSRMKILPFISHLSKSVQTGVLHAALSAALRPKE